MHVITWNVNNRLAKCLDGIRDLNPDIVLLQEVRVSAENAFKSRLQSKGLSYWSSGGCGSVIASKWQISEPFFFKWPKSVLCLQPAHRATVYSSDGDIDVINVHVPNGSKHGWDKIYTLEGIANVIQDAPDGPRILAGDFNEPIEILPNGRVITSESVRRGRRPGEPWTDPQGRTDDLRRWDQGVRRIFEGDDHLRLRHVRHLVPGHPLMPVTYRTRRSDRFFDHVFLSRHFRVSKVEYIHHVREAGDSDHSPVYVEIHSHQPA